MDKLNTTKNITKFLNELDEQNYHMLEDEVDIETQNKYFKHSRKLSSKVDKNEILASVPLLNDNSVSKDIKKKILGQLALLHDVEAYRILEKKCRQFDDDELNTWSILAYNESKMVINGSLKNEQQVFISTGLGGKDGKFRYFVVFLPHEDTKAFSAFQRNFIQKELDFTLKQNHSVLEKTVEETEEYISFKILIPLKTNVPKLFKNILDNCNQLSPFVSKQFIITNVGEMNKEEINEFMEDVDDDDENIIMEDIISLN